ncbi:hypothetical protein MTR67_028310 [Solanum verrucosum]|uniref:DRBM domain-containing protein n=1 Tax=Solanum verrucosum TaxID=315347 RepID=A0AAF0R5U8_SOLVR|nr:hypothetical protein MTR67_028310 [Solanum verrucosum]
MMKRLDLIAEHYRLMVDAIKEYATEKDGPDHNPRFTATVTVNGVSFELPKDQWRSSKEAQNHAAHIAYDHFIVPQSIPLLTPQPSLLPTSSDVSQNCLTSCTSIPLNGGSWRRGFQGQEAKTNKQAEMNATNRLTQG